MFKHISTTHEKKIHTYLYEGYGHILKFKYLEILDENNCRTYLQFKNDIAPGFIELTFDANQEAAIRTSRPIYMLAERIDELTEYLNLIKTMIPEIESLRKEIEEKHESKQELNHEKTT